LTKDGVKLEQMVRINIDGPVVEYPWEDLLAVIWNLVRAARAMYPQLRGESQAEAEAEATRRISDEQMQVQSHLQLKGMHPESLQGLAIAATEMQSCVAVGVDEANATTNALASPTTLSNPVSQDDVTQQQQPPSEAQSPLPTSERPFLVKAMLTKGLSTVESVEEWRGAMDDVGSSVWAAGRMTVVVELT
jgi:hypothetical protein